MLDDLKPIIYNEGDSDIVIYPLFDLHVGSAQFNERDFIAWREMIAAQDNARVVIGGDLMDNGLKNSVTNVYEQTMRPRDQKRYIAELLKPIKDKILCGTSGNHEKRSVKDSDDDPLYDVFCKIDIEDRFRENACFVIIRMNGADQKLKGSKRPSYNIMVTHGAGGGMYIGSGANKGERFGMAIDGLDALITGHTHKPLTFPVGKLVIDPQNKKVTQKQFTCLTASSWLDYGGYPIRKMLMPAARVPQKMILSAHGKNITIVQG
jgi:hypothetical protein